MRAAVLLVVFGGCDVVFGTPFEADDEPPRDAAATTSKCSGAMDERLCLTFDGDSDDLGIDGSAFHNDVQLANVTPVERAPGEGAVEVGATSEIRIEDDVGLELEGPLTYAMWVYSSLEQNDPATALDNHAQFAIAARSNNGGPLNIRCVFSLAPSHTLVVTTAPHATARWTHVACVKDETGLTLYVNGAFASKNTSADAMGAVATGNPEPVRIGQDAQPGDMVGAHWIGRLDDVYVFARALGPAEIFMLAQR